MVSFFSQTVLFDHSWATVNQGLWRKYPNPYSGHVVSVDVLERTVDPETGVVRTERVLGCKQAAPRWVVKFLGGSEDAFVREVSFVDPRTQRTTITTVNLSLSQYMTVLENIVYEPSPSTATTTTSSSSPSSPAPQTVFKQTAEIQARTSGLWRGIGEKLENWSVERFSKNAALGKLGFEHVLKVLCEGGEKMEMVVASTSDAAEAS